ncbi:ALPHA-MANNOSIDASE domain protein [Mycobacterium xenopi 3993]|nr:ALPHA-MANNOSIDASE domain protein [Mycobacterium xenopi 3993]
MQRRRQVPLRTPRRRLQLAGHSCRAGRPDQNVFTKAVLATAHPAYSAELDRQLEQTGRARVWVPAVAPLATAWVPGADLREPRALPVLVIAGRDDSDLAAAVAALTDDLADAEVVVSQQVPAQLPPFEARTVALLNRGCPASPSTPTAPCTPR